MFETEFKTFESKWIEIWKTQNTYKVFTDENKPKYYCLDMFPYPSGAGLHVGHPRGYIASDVFSRYKKMLGFNVLHPLGFDSFGLPAEQYAIETGQHPAATTEININKFKMQLAKLGLNHDADREINTSDPAYYRWTQWIFLKLFNSWYDPKEQKSRPISELITILQTGGTSSLDHYLAASTPRVNSDTWSQLSNFKKEEFLGHYRLAYKAEIVVNWCPYLGTVLANDEVVNGRSERGAHPVIKRKMSQWLLRITAYANRLLDNLDTLDWPEPVKTIQRNWIGRITGQYLILQCHFNSVLLNVFCTDIDKIYDAKFVVISPDHPLCREVLSGVEDSKVEFFLKQSIETGHDCKKPFVPLHALFSGNYVNFGNNTLLPVFISNYISPLGLNSKLGVPDAGTIHERFWNEFGCFADKEIISHSSGKPAEILQGTKATHFKLRDAVFGRQRYWGEPIPIFYDSEGTPTGYEEFNLPLLLPEVTSFIPTQLGDAPLARLDDWKYRDYQIETTTMPGWAASSWYFLRFSDPHNANCFASKENTSYWNSVDMYVGGIEHATGHLIYARFLTNFLYDIGEINFYEPFKRLVCQGMILGLSAIIFRDNASGDFVSADLLNTKELHPVYIDTKLVDENNGVDIEKLRSWRKDFAEAKFQLSGGVFLCRRLTEKMSKSKHNVITPDDVIAKYGADCFRLHEMFLGPIDQTMTWSTDTIEGPFRFLSRLWRLFFNDAGQLMVVDEIPSAASQNLINNTIILVSKQTAALSFNTAIATMMSCVNELARNAVFNSIILEKLLLILHPFAPFITSELWQRALRKRSDITLGPYPSVISSSISQMDLRLPVAINGKTRFYIRTPQGADAKSVQALVMSDENSKKWLPLPAKRVIFVPGKIINFILDPQPS